VRVIAPVVLRRAPSAGPVEEWALVLAATGIEHEVTPAEGEWHLVIDGDKQPAAEAALQAYELERVQAAKPRPTPPDYGSTRVGLLGALALVGIWLLTAARPGVVERGAAIAERILHGEWWRAITALTLHADLAHILGNAAALWVLLAAVGSWVGPALGAWLVLGAGFSGNLMTAWVAGARHSSIGASTATFAALGALAGLRLGGGKRVGGRGTIALFAAAALLGLLGAGERADVLAHLFGFASGVLLALPLGILFDQAPKRTLLQPLGALAALGAVAGAWALALR
jgi:membrane associated rhomboid family serine protease